MVDGSGRMGSPAVLDRTGLIETFREPVVQHQLSAARWIEHYLPHWTTPDRWAARFEVGSTGIRFRIDADQLPWRAEDGEMRCSCLQTGVFAGPVGSEAGQHRYRDGLLVRSASPTRHLFTPSAGIVDAVMRAVPDPSVMLAVWLVGIEDRSPDDSGEICIAELFGKAFGPGGSDVSMGIKAHNDPRLREDMVRPRLALDATAWHRLHDGMERNRYPDPCRRSAGISLRSGDRLPAGDHDRTVRVPGRWPPRPRDVPPDRGRARGPGLAAQLKESGSE